MQKRLIRIIVAFILLILSIIMNIYNKGLNPDIVLLTFLVSYIIVGYDIIIKAIRNIFNGNIFDENFLMSIATIGAFIIGEHPEGVAIMLFYQVGELFQDYALDKSRKSIANLMDIRPDYANVNINGNIIKKDPEEVKIGDTIIIKAGEKVPLDVKIIEGESSLDVSALTGESLPKDVKPGDSILSASININGLLTAKVEKEFGQSTVSKILDLVKNASSKKSQSEKFITRFARYYTPIVVILAALLAFIPPLIIEEARFANWIYRALSFLVVSCPCALVVSVPLSFFGGIGASSKKGILVKGSNYLETLSQVRTIAFDKTGSLTKGTFEVQEVKPVDVSKEELVDLASHAECFSNHPISKSIINYYGKEIDKDRVSNVKEILGQGIIATVDGKEIQVGNKKLISEIGLNIDFIDLLGTRMYVAIDKKYAGYILISDKLKADSRYTINSLKDNNINNIAMLTGDNKSVGNKVASSLGIEEVYSELLPGDKVDIVEKMLNNRDKYGKVAFVGDGINDAPVLSRVDIGIAMGALGSDAAIEAADIVIMTDEPSKIITAINISKRTLNIVKQNTVFAIGIKIIVLILSALGLTSLWAAVFADVGVTILAVLNSLRALKVSKL